MKKCGFGAGRYNGFGGKLHSGETLEEAARREISEEGNITPTTIESRGILTFRWENKPEALIVHLFRFWYSGEPSESEEMRPEYFVFKDIPYDKMWQDDKHWLPLFLQGKSVSGDFLFDKDDALLSYTLKDVR